jgi:exodeoxyribonuclease X
METAQPHYAVVFDTETANISTDPEKPSLMIEAAYLAFEGIQNTSPALIFHQRYNPFPAEHRDAPMKAGLMGYGALATHHILPSMLIGMPAPETFHLPAGTVFLIGHNVDYDWNAIQPWHQDCAAVRRIDTLPLARKAWPGLDSYSQSAVLYFLADTRPELLNLEQAKVLLTRAHSAQTDVIGCSILLRALIDHFMPALWNDLWKLSEAARIPDTMYFGKHKGTSIEEIPLDYCQWMLKQPDIDPYLRTAMERRLASGMAAVPSAPDAMALETPAAS